MKRTFMGIVAGVLIAVSGFAVAFYGGWISVSSGTSDMAAASEGLVERSRAEAPTAGAADDRPAGAPAAEPSMEGLETTEPASSDMPPGTVTISAEQQQLIGLRTARVERQSLDRTIRTVGLVEYDERRVAHIHTKITGWIEALQVDFTGEFVEEGQQLLEIYSPELLSTQEEFLLALRAQESLRESSFPEVARSAVSLLEATRRRLQLWDVTDEQIMALEEMGEPFETLPIYSPIRGFVIHKAAYEGQYVGPDSELYTIADLQEVWITADIYEYDLPLVEVGQSVQVTLPYFPGEKFEGRVDYVYPYLAGETRTAKARLVFSNPDLKLKPDMYANVVLTADLGDGLVIPEDAVIDTGVRKVAFRALPGGHFQPVEIETGFKVGEWLQVLSGLEEGEEIVTGAAFLVNSESKLGSALRSMGGMRGMQH